MKTLGMASQTSDTPKNPEDTKTEPRLSLRWNNQALHHPDTSTYHKIPVAFRKTWKTQERTLLRDWERPQNTLKEKESCKNTQKYPEVCGDHCVQGDLHGEPSSAVALILRRSNNTHSRNTTFKPLFKGFFYVLHANEDRSDVLMKFVCLHA